jgi:hypothetical protein
MHQSLPFRRFRIEQLSPTKKEPVDADDVLHVVEQGSRSPFLRRRALLVHPDTDRSTRVGSNESDHSPEASGIACAYRESDDGWH